MINTQLKLYDWTEVVHFKNLATGTYILNIFDYDETAYYSGIFTYVKNGTYKLEEINMHAQIPEGAVRCYFGIKDGSLIAKSIQDSKHRFIIQIK